MTWQKWVLLAWYAISVLITVATVGKPRKPIEPGVAAASMVIYAGLIALVVTA